MRPGCDLGPAAGGTVPLCKSSKDDVFAQFTMTDIAEVGLIKFDFLGLKTLTVIKDTLRFIEKGGA
jgi:DNA polymerase-3 subunit alpha